MSSFRAKDSQVQNRQLEAQSFIAVCNLVAATSDAPSIVSINSGTIASTSVVVEFRESISKAYKVQVIDRQTGTVKALTSVAVSGSQVTVVLDATGLSDVALELCYKVVE